MSDISFNDPGYFALLLPALLLVAFFWYLGFVRYRWGRKRYGDPSLVDRFSRPVKMVSHLTTLGASLLAVALLVVALAGPYMPAAPVKENIGNLQVVAVFQVSRDMAAQDYINSLPKTWRLRFFQAHGTRLDEAKYVLGSDILPSIPNNQVAIVNYQGDANPVADLTTDYTYLNYVLDNWVYVGNAPYGTGDSTGKISDIASGLNAALGEFQRFGNARAQKVIVLFSDGDNDADPTAMSQAMDELSKQHIRLVVIGLGGAPVPIPQYNAQGQYTGYYTYPDGTVPTSGIDEGSLSELAAQAHGTYIRLNPGHLPSINWPSQLSSATKTVIEQRLLYEYPLVLAWLIIIMLGLKGSLKSSFAWARRLTRSHKGSDAR